MTEGVTVLSVPFVLKQNGHFVADSTSITLSYSSTNGGAFFDPPNSASVGANGGFSLDLTGQTPGNVTITATWGSGKSASCTVRVNEATYDITDVTVSPASIEAWESVTFTATITKNGSPVPDGETVTWTIASGNGKFTGGPTSTTSGGKATITLQGTAAGSVTVKASIRSADNQASVTFTAPAYSIGFVNLPSGAQIADVLLKAKVTNSQGSPAEGVSVSWSYVNKQGGSIPDSLGDIATDASGESQATIPYLSGERRTITVTASMNGTNITTDIQLGEALPSGFIALASGEKTWAAAKTYCSSQGGKLPRVNNSDSWDGTTGTASFDGFGTALGPWPSGLSLGSYWTDTVHSSYPLNRFLVHGDSSGKVYLRYTAYFNNNMVICVP